MEGAEYLVKELQAVLARKEEEQGTSLWLK